MTKNTKLIFTTDETHLLTSKFKILSEESRLRILQILHNNEKSVTDIVAETGLLQANVSKQLKLLNQVGIVTFRIYGKQHMYKIADDQILKICKIICQNKSKNE
jgi:DNA-binding transcriptional ArsR family regulator